MVRVFYRGIEVVRLERLDIEMWFLMRWCLQKPSDSLEIIAKRWKVFKEGFKVLQHYGGLWICKDFEIYPLSFFDLVSLLERNDELIIDWEIAQKKEAFWVESGLTQIKDFDECVCRVNYREVPEFMVKLLMSVRGDLVQKKMKKKQR